MRFKYLFEGINDSLIEINGEKCKDCETDIVEKKSTKNYFNPVIGGESDSSEGAVAESCKKKNESINDSSISEVESFIEEVKKRFKGSEAVYDGDSNTIKITLSEWILDKFKKKVTTSDIESVVGNLRVGNKYADIEVQLVEEDEELKEATFKIIASTKQQGTSAKADIKVTVPLYNPKKLSQDSELTRQIKKLETNLNKILNGTVDQIKKNNLEDDRRRREQEEKRKINFP